MFYCISNMLRVLTFLVAVCTLATTASAQVPNLRLLISDFNNNRILRYDGATGTFLNTLVTKGRGGLNQPHESPNRTGRQTLREQPCDRQCETLRRSHRSIPGELCALWQWGVVES